MVFVHIVLVKVKAQVLSNGYEEFVKKAETLADLEISKKVVKTLKWGPPVYDQRAHGWNYGLYSTFDSKADYDQYKVDEGHANFVKQVLLPNVDDILAYDIEV